MANDTDVDGDTLTLASFTQPGAGQGTVTQVVPGTLRYTPVAGFTGLATFDYVVADGNGGSDTGTVTITVAPRLEILDASVTEGNSGLVDLVFTVRLTGPSPTPVSATLTTANGTATAGADYQATTGTVTIPAGTVSVTVPVQVFGDLLDEPDETFTATLSAPSGATIGDGTATGTIVDDDPPPSLSVNDVSIVEGNLGTTAMEFKVALSSASAKAISVAFATADTGATAGVDYQSATGALTFDPGETLKSVFVQVIGDTAFEPTETFSLTLSAPVDATIADGVGVGTILNDDAQSGGPTTCTITGTAGADALTGTDGRDVICGLGGDDVLTGLGGDDILLGAAGNDTLSAGDGADSLDGGAGNDDLDGGVGTDTLDGGSGNDTVSGDAGDDTVRGGIGDDLLAGNLGDDTIEGGGGADIVTYAASATGVTVDLGGGSAGAVGEGTDALKSIASARGSELGDTITGSNQANLIEGLGGPDRLLALNGDDTLNGGAGDDELRGGRGFNVLIGGAGTDDCSNAPGSGQIFECEVVSALTMVVSGTSTAPAKPSRASTAFTRSGQTATRTVTLPASSTGSWLTLTWDDPGAKFSVVTERTRPERRLLRPERIRGTAFLALRVGPRGRAVTLRLRIRADALARATTVA